MNFETQHMQWIAKTEGGYNNHPADEGGATKYGISHRAYPTLNIADLTIEDALEIYKVDYYDAYRLDELPPKLALVMFDAFVNHRPKTAARMLQHAVSTLADGNIGPLTVAAAQSANEGNAVATIIKKRGELYDGIATANSTQIVFLNGWKNRLIDLLIFAFIDFKPNENEA